MPWTMETQRSARAVVHASLHHSGSAIKLLRTRSSLDGPWRAPASLRHVWMEGRRRRTQRIQNTFRAARTQLIVYFFSSFGLSHFFPSGVLKKNKEEKSGNRHGASDPDGNAAGLRTSVSIRVRDSRPDSIGDKQQSTSCTARGRAATEGSSPLF